MALKEKGIIRGTHYNPITSPQDPKIDQHAVPETQLPSDIANDDEDGVFLWTTNYIVLPRWCPSTRDDNEMYKVGHQCNVNVIVFHIILHRISSRSIKVYLSLSKKKGYKKGYLMYHISLPFPNSHRQLCGSSSVWMQEKRVKYSGMALFFCYTVHTSHKCLSDHLSHAVRLEHQIQLLKTDEASIQSKPTMMAWSIPGFI